MIMKIFWKTWICCIGLAILLLACEEIDVRQPLAKVDAVYISLWLSLQQADLKAAQLHMDRLEEEWELLQAMLVDEEDLFYWEKDINRIDGLLQEANWAIKAENSIHAYVAVDRIRYKLIRLREEYEVDYYLDKIWAFQIAYADFQEVADDDVLCWLGWDSIAEMEEELRLLWQPIDETITPPAYFELDLDQISAFNAWQTKIRATLINLKEAVQCANREEMAVVSTELGLQLNNLIKQFGTLEKQVAPINKVNI